MGKNMALRKIMQLNNDDILRTKSEEVEKIDEEIRILLRDMTDTMFSFNASGLSAVQIGIPKRVVVLKGVDRLFKLINPVIIKQYGEQQATEGCISIPGIIGKVKRPYSVLIKALDDRGKTIVFEGNGFMASAACHELDHLDGVLFIDKVVPGTLVKF
jgi:peptide deformylase